SSELIRFVIGQADTTGHRPIAADLGSKSFGRGTWSHPRLECLSKAAKSGFSRSLRTSVPLALSDVLMAVELAAERKIRGLLVGAVGAKAVVKGSDSVRDAAERVSLVLLAEDARATAQSGWLREFIDRGRCEVWGTKAQLGDFFGRE